MDKTDLKWLMKRHEEYQERYIEAEKFILELAKMKWYERIFSFKRLMKFIESRSKYKF